jgi:hypothetical protein
MSILLHFISARRPASVIRTVAIIWLTPRRQLFAIAASRVGSSA